MLQSAFLAERYKDQFAFCGQFRMGGPYYTLNIYYFRIQYQHSYNSAAQVARDYVQLAASPIRKWHVKQDPQSVGAKEGWQAADVDYSTWRTTDPAVETWSTIGLHSYFGKLWYRTFVDLPKPASGRRVYLWIGSLRWRPDPLRQRQALPGDQTRRTGDMAAGGLCNPREIRHHRRGC